MPIMRHDADGHDQNVGDNAASIIVHRLAFLYAAASQVADRTLHVEPYGKPELHEYLLTTEYTRMNAEDRLSKRKFGLSPCGQWCSWRLRRTCIRNYLTLLRTNEHRVAVAVKTVLVLHRRPICRQDPFPSGKGGNEHQQRRLRQMKVRDNAVDDPENETGINEQPGTSLPGSDRSVFLCGGLKGAHAGRPDGNDAPALALRAVDRFGCIRSDLKALRQHPVFGDLFDANGLKGAGPDVKRDHGRAHAFRRQACRATRG